ncbi:MAG: hypothetical protein GY953_07400 [bacterium]|nr:hypothetical protein [bacterium]
MIRLLEERLHPEAAPPAKAPYHDLDHLFGSWSKSEAAEFDEALREQRSIDEEMWK